MKYLLVFFITVLVCQDRESSQYSPLTPGNSWYYETMDGAFDEFISDQPYIHKGIYYVQSIKKYSDKTTEVSLFRIAADGTVYYLDTETFKETPEIPAKPRLNYQWSSTDEKWKYKIIALGVELKTPNRIFKDCMAIKSTSQTDTNQVYINYYAKGIGFVGTKVGGDLVTYLVRWSKKNKQS